MEREEWVEGGGKGGADKNEPMVFSSEISARLVYTTVDE